MNRAKIILLCTLSACGYGIVHDQITVRVCAEYLSVAHPPLFPTRSPTLLALCWGIAATGFVGIALGAVLSTVAQAGSQPPQPVASFYKPVFTLLVVMALSAFVAGMAGYEFTRNGSIAVPDPVTRVIPSEKHAQFMAVWFAHMTSYLVGLAGGALLCFRLWRERGRPAALAFLPRSRAAFVRVAILLAMGAVIAWFRFRAR